VALRLAEDARLRPLSLTVAAHNLPTLARLPRDSHVAWVHCAAGATELLFLIGDALVFSRGLAGTDDALVAEELQRSLLALRWRGYDAVWVSGDADAPHAPTAEALSALGAPVTEPAWPRRCDRCPCCASSPSCCRPTRGSRPSRSTPRAWSSPARPPPRARSSRCSRTRRAWSAWSSPRPSRAAATTRSSSASARHGRPAAPSRPRPRRRPRPAP